MPTEPWPNQNNATTQFWGRHPPVVKHCIRTQWGPPSDQVFIWLFINLFCPLEPLSEGEIHSLLCLNTEALELMLQNSIVIA